MRCRKLSQFAGATWNFRSDSMFDEASTSQCNGGFHAWFKRLQIAHIAVSGQISSLIQSHQLHDARRYGRVVIITDDP